MEKCDDLAIFNMKEKNLILDYLNNNDKGYLTFVEFSEKIHPYMTNID